MARLGLQQTAGSGNSWIAKEDGESDTVLCQLKSTDADSIRIKKQDIDALLYHAAVAHKVPLFAIQFLQTEELYLMVRPEDLRKMAFSLHMEDEVPDTEFSEHLEIDSARAKWYALQKRNKEKKAWN